MAKRAAEPRDESPHSKRAKVHHASEAKKESLEIRSPNDLHRLLAFKQDAGPQTKQDIKTFKSFLEKIAHNGDSEDTSTKRTILFDYLQSQSPNRGQEKSIFLQDLIQTWRFSAQGQNDSLYSLTTAVLALLLETISSLIDFRDYGNQFCGTILLDEHVKLFDRGLTANRHKEYLISPCLRLLTELVSFDGGSVAKAVYRKRQTTFQRLHDFLTMRKDPTSEDVESRRRSSVRSNALRYLLANLRLQGHIAKVYLLNQGRITQSLVQGIANDPPYLVLDILGVLRRDVAQDTGLSMILKRRFFNDRTLGRLASLYGYKESGDGARNATVKIQDAAHSFLLSVCTSPDYGLLHDKEKKPRIDAEDTAVTSTSIDIEDSSKTGINKPSGYHDSFVNFLSSLRPYADGLHNELVLACFRIMPQLTDDYFSRKQGFSFDPKLTATWIGYSLLLLSTVQLPIPDSCWRMESDGQIFVETMTRCILPSPLTRKTMTRCLNQSSNLITFFATRILNAAFKKLADTLHILKSMHNFKPGTPQQEAEQISLRLVSDFSRRCPEMKHVISQVRSCPKENAMQRESIGRLMSNYYKFTPRIALEEKFDISSALWALLREIESNEEGSHRGEILLLELDHLLEVAHRSPDMQWWHRSEGMQFSPFTTLLKIHVHQKPNEEKSQMRHLLIAVAEENAIFRSDNKPSSFDVLILSLRGFTNPPSDGLYKFIDNCISRLAQKPVKYFDALTSLPFSAAEAHGYDTDLLIIAIAEQWPFLIKNSSLSVLTLLSEWLARYMNVALHFGGNKQILSHISSQLATGMENGNCRALIEMALEQPPDTHIGEALGREVLASQEDVAAAEAVPQSTEETTEPLEALFPVGPPEENANHPRLNRWSKEEAADAISEGSIEELVLCLCSQHEEIRKQALVNVRTFMAKLEASSYSERRQTLLLVGEVAETATDIIPQQPFPYFAGALAAYSLLVLANPLHFMYEKVNKFLMKGPQWNLAKLPSYWVDRILLHEPTDNDDHYREVEWLLDVLLEGLRILADMDNYRQCQVFERLLSMATSPGLPDACFEKIVALLYRCTYVDGSTTLITRCGLLSWVACSIPAEKGRRRDELVYLVSRAYETSDRAHVDEWSDGAFKPTLDGIRRYPERG